MSDTLGRIIHLWPQVNLSRPSPIEIPNVTRDDLAHLFAALEFNLGVEVGTERGLYAETLCAANPNLQLTCVDPYRVYSGYREHLSQNKLNGFYDEAFSRLRRYDVRFIRESSITAVDSFPDNSLDWVYIDGNHSLPYVIADLHAWIPKVRKGGIVSGHDFIRRNNRLRYQCHVVEAVYAYTQSYMIEPWFIIGAKDKGEKRDAIRSFMWIKS